MHCFSLATDDQELAARRSQSLQNSILTFSRTRSGCQYPWHCHCQRALKLQQYTEVAALSAGTTKCGRTHYTVTKTVSRWQQRWEDDKIVWSTHRTRNALCFKETLELDRVVPQTSTASCPADCSSPDTTRSHCKAALQHHKFIYCISYRQVEHLLLHLLMLENWIISKLFQGHKSWRSHLLACKSLT
jgi:hypothetical protein